MTQQQSVVGLCFDRRVIPATAREGWWTAADGHAIRRIDWSAAPDKSRGSLLFLPGRGDFYEKYLETLDHWYRRGWGVTALDWRGQGGSGTFADGTAAAPIDDFGAWTRDLADFWRLWIGQTPPPHMLVGHSMGGHIVLRAMADRHVRPDAAVLSAPMLGLQPQFVPNGILHRLARGIARVRGAWTAVRKTGEQSARVAIDRLDLLTHDADRYADEAWWRQERPELAFTAPTWGWIERSLASMAMLERPGVLEAVDVPVLILAAQDDRLVSYRAIRKAAARLPSCELVTFGNDARHELLREADDLRGRVLAAIDRFLDEAVRSADSRS